MGKKLVKQLASMISGSQSRSPGPNQLSFFHPESLFAKARIYWLWPHFKKTDSATFDHVLTNCGDLEQVINHHMLTAVFSLIIMKPASIIEMLRR